MGDLTVVDAATSVHHTATTDEAWDGPAAVAAMPANAATLRACHAWVDSTGDPDAKSSYKFPHHRTKGGPANLAACRNGLARLSSAHIPDGDRAGVKRHLQAHLDDAGSRSDRLNQLAAFAAARPRNFKRPDMRPTTDQGEPGWYRIVNQASAADVYLYDDIGYGGVSALDFVAELRALDSVPINLHINSRGGDVFDGVAIYTALMQHPADITTYVDGIAASAASFIAQAGTRVVMSKPATMMVHKAWGMCVGDDDDMHETGNLLAKLSGTIAGIYADRTGGTVDGWLTTMRAETWFTADEAVAASLAHEIAGAPDRSAPVPMNRTWDLSIFNYAGRPAAPAPQPPAPEPVPEPVSWFTPEAFRSALREAVA